ncbi:MAG TPA: hypothetical protein VIL69_19335 [Roseomonas sp.]|jgi:hypothetical protein
MTEYRIFFGTRGATREELDRVEEITVEQEADMAWEARLKLALCVDEKGRWQHTARTFALPFSRVRVELRQGTGTWVPLIDGPVAGLDSALDSQPGRSTVTLVVRDDSVLLNRNEKVEIFQDRLDSDVAREVFGELPGGASPRTRPTTSPQRTTTRRGTAIVFLRELARANGYRAYVLPGDEPGKSIGCFLPDPRSPGTLPPLVLLGSERNLADVEVRENNEGPERTQGRTLRIADQGIVSVETTQQDVGLMRPLPPVSNDQTALRLLPPTENAQEDPAAPSAARTLSAAYAYKVTGRVVPGCYAGVLAPYQLVLVRVGDLHLSGNWLLTKVRHRISPDLYAQEFEALCDGQEDPAAAATPGPNGLSVALSASLSVI